MRKHKTIFELGKYTGPDLKIQVTLEAVLKICKARSIPFCQRELVEPELSRLGAAGIIELICPLKWAYVRSINVTWKMYGAN